MSDDNTPLCDEEERVMCDYTGRECHGDKKFCEECDVVLGEPQK